jgi:hypothetical protein
MTISESIATWLQGYSIMEINTDELKAEAETFGLFETPDDSSEEFLDGSILRTEYYIFLIRRNAQLESERISNQQFIEGLSEWVREQELAGKYPENMNIEKVWVAYAYMQEREEQEAIYQVSLGIERTIE